MKVIKNDEALVGKNSDRCKTIEYSFDDKDIDLGIAIITGRYPERGYCYNKECKELIFILEGRGELCFENNSVSFDKGDSILIDKNEKYYWNSEYCKVSMSCAPAWSPEQHVIED